MPQARGLVRACFLDIDGVILNPEHTPREWQRLVGEVLAPALGGNVADWGPANAVVVARLFGGDVWSGHPDPVTNERLVGIAWIRGLCEELGFEPPTDERALTLARAAEVHVCTHTRAAYPGASEAIRELAGMTALHTATGNHSLRVEPLLTQLGVREHFGVLTGPDLVRVHKHTSAFYERTFEAARVAPTEALVVDDQPGPLALAAAQGARTVLVGQHPASDLADYTLPSITALPALLASLTASG